MDEGTFEQYCGFSIAFSTTHLTVNPDRSPDIEITFNPRLFPRDDVADLVKLSTHSVQINAVELVQKGLDVPAIIFLSFASGAIASGFFGSIGSDIYKALKDKIREFGTRIKTEHDEDLRCNITFHFDHNDRDTQVLVSLKSADLEILEARGITAESIIDHIREVAGDKQLQKVVVQAKSEEPVLFIDYLTDVEGNVENVMETTKEP